MLGAKKSLAIALALVLALGVLPRETARASSTCTITVNPSIIATGSQTQVDFTITNTGADPISWIQLQRPTLSYTVLEGAQSGWSNSTDEDGTTLSDGTVDPGGTATIQLEILAAPQEEETAAWTVRLSSNNDGSDMFTCDGSTSTTISSPPTPPMPNGQSDIRVSTLTPTSATVTWQSSLASTSYVYYGPSGSYGHVATTSGSGLSHAVTLTGLTPSTLYHYMVAGSDASAHNLFSSDNTFMTPAEPLPATPPAPEPNAAPKQFAKVQNDTTAPVITVKTALAQPFATAPTVTGSVTDNGRVARIQYSTDGGQNWLPATSTGLGTTKAGFSTSPFLQGDGNYLLVIAATDSNGNQGTSQPATLVIDRLLPQVGPPVISFGPEVITPNTHNVMNLLVGASYQVIASAVGGATAVRLEANPVAGSAAVPGSFTLAQSADDGLWSGQLSFKLAGTYHLMAVGRDGANNQTSQQIMTVVVNPAGHVLDGDSHLPIANTKLTVHVFESSTRTWQIWEGGPYRQTNPQLTRTDGTYSFTVPAGTYFVSAEAPNHVTFTSEGFSTDKPFNIAAILTLMSLPHISLGPLTIYQPDWGWQAQALPASPSVATAAGQSLVGQQLPAFDLPTLAGGHLNSVKLEGRPTDVVVLTTWAGDGQNQLPALAEAQTHNDINVMPLFSQQRRGQVSAYIDMAGYQLAGLVDPDGIVAPKLLAGSQPMHLFIDRTGRIKKVALGVLSKSEILDILGGL